MISLEEQQILDKIYSAVDLLDTKNYTIEQLRGYDQFIDNIMIRETDLDEAEKRGIEKGKIEGIDFGMEKGMEVGRNEGREQGQMEIFLIISDLKGTNLSIEQIAEKYGVKQQKVYEIKKLIY